MIACLGLTGVISGSRKADQRQTALREYRIVDTIAHSPIGHLHEGFVAMEYFALIFNRSFLVFLTDKGLQGWKFVGPVTARYPEFFKPIEALLDDPEMTPGSAPFDELMTGPHTFVIPYNEIKSVEFLAKAKWGMAAIPHSGILVVETVSGSKREFILLGAAYGYGIRDLILSRSGVNTSGG